LAVLLPGLMIAAGMGIDVAGWASAEVRMQRTADIAAIAAVNSYNVSGDAHKAAIVAVQLAEINGISGSASPSWNAGTETLTAGNIIVQFATGQIQSTDPALTVTVATVIPVAFAGFVNLTQVTVGATSKAELLLVTTVNAGGQPCVLALAGNTGITLGVDLVINGLATVNASNCTLRSNDAVLISGLDSITAQAIYAGGLVLNVGINAITGSVYQNQGKVADPYAENVALQTALTTANAAVGISGINCLGTPVACTGPTSSVSCAPSGCTIRPGTYSGFTATGTGQITLAPGLYTFTSSILVTGSLRVTAANVTILLASTSLGLPTSAIVSGASTLVLTAATTLGATNNQIPGVVFASQTIGSAALIGANLSPEVGLIYYPNGSFSITGLGDTGSAGCFQVIANTVIINGWAEFDASICDSSYGLEDFGSQTGVLQARLVR
jgi:hypothetical protein